MAWFCRKLCGILKVLVGTLMAVLIVPVSLQVFNRFIPGMPHMLWTEELSRFLFVWIVMLGSAIGVYEKEHFAVHVIPEAATKKKRALQSLLVTIAIGTFAAFFIVRGIPYAEFGAKQVSDVMQVNRSVTYLAVPISGVLWMIFVLNQFIQDLRNLLRGD